MQANENKSCEYYETEAKGEKQKENQTIEIWNHEEKITNLIFYFRCQHQCFYSPDFLN